WAAAGLLAVAISATAMFAPRTARGSGTTGPVRRLVDTVRRTGSPAPTPITGAVPAAPRMGEACVPPAPTRPQMGDLAGPRPRPPPPPPPPPAAAPAAPAPPPPRAARPPPPGGGGGGGEGWGPPPPPPPLRRSSRRRRRVQRATSADVAVANDAPASTWT